MSATEIDHTNPTPDEPRTTPMGRRGALSKLAGTAALAGGAALMIDAIAGTPAHAAPDNTPFVTKSSRAVSVWDYGAKGDGVTDDSAAITAAAQAAGEGGTVSFEKGTHALARFNVGAKGVTMLAFQTWHGGTQIIGAGPSATAEIVAPNLEKGESAITAGSSCTLKDMRLTGPGSKKEVYGFWVQVPTVRVERVQFVRWWIAEHIRYCYYSEHTSCEWRHNKTGQVIRNSYRVDNIGPMYNCMVDGEKVGGTAIDINVARSCNIVGGSIEAFGGMSAPGIIMGANAPSALNLYGTYWESTRGWSGGNAVGMVWKENWAVNTIGNTVYLTDLDCWLYGGPNVTGGSLTGMGNTFVCAGDTITSPVAYKINEIKNTTVELDGTDVWLYMAAKAVYTDITLPRPYAHVAKPVGSGTDLHEYRGRNQVLPAGYGFRPGPVTAANRPSAQALGAGTMVYDTGLAKPIWSDGTAWRDANGVAV